VKIERGKRALGAFVLGVGIAVAGCGGSKPAAPVGASTAPPEEPIRFAFDSLDARPVTSDATRGKPTVVAFVTTGNIGSQAQVDFLVAMAKHDAEKVNYVLVALEPRENRELVEFYRDSLKVTFPTAVASVEMLTIPGGFGEIPLVPTTVLLDSTGKIVWRVEGRVAKSDEIRASMRGLDTRLTTH
jgi:hypothetical protein